MARPLKGPQDKLAKDARARVVAIRTEEGIEAKEATGIVLKELRMHTCVVMQINRVLTRNFATYGSVCRANLNALSAHLWLAGCSNVLGTGYSGACSSTLTLRLPLLRAHSGKCKSITPSGNTTRRFIDVQSTSPLVTDNSDPTERPAPPKSEGTRPPSPTFFTSSSQSLKPLLPGYQLLAMRPVLRTMVTQ